MISVIDVVKSFLFPDGIFVEVIPGFHGSITMPILFLFRFLFSSKGILEEVASLFIGGLINIAGTLLSILLIFVEAATSFFINPNLFHVGILVEVVSRFV